jgi:DNA-binding MarR family transcriptional regulator
MEKQGIVSRKKGEQDKRQQIVSLTAKGKQLEQEAFELVPAGMKDQLATCPLEFADFQQLAQELDAIINTLKK